MIIKPKAAQANAPTGSGSGSNVSSAKCVMCVNTAAAGTNYLVTVQTASAAATLGTFTIIGGSVQYVEKDPTDEIFAANAAVKLTPVAFQSG